MYGLGGYLKHWAIMAFVLSLPSGSYELDEGRGLMG